MDLKQYDSVYFLGIGGIGMSALARWFRANGFPVAGYDRTPSELTLSLESEGMAIHYEDDVELIPADFRQKSTLVVLTPAIPKDSKEWAWFRSQEITIHKRSEVLGMISGEMTCVAVAGTHGKTTTTTILTHLLVSANIDVAGFMGGISKNFGSNLVLNKKPAAESIAVVEADEYDRSFMRLKPNLAIITSADPDHLDIYGDREAFKATFVDFMSLIPADGLLVVQEKVAADLLDKVGRPLPHITYGLESGQVRADNIRVENGLFVFDYLSEKVEIRDLEMLLPGYHNIENALAAITIALHLGASAEQIREGIQHFQGVKRRFEYILRNENIVLVDDYAHHPSELSAFLRSLKFLYPGEKIAAVFQPHLFTRTRDFAQGFSESLSMADEVVLLDIYPARELPIAGVESAMLLPHISSPKKSLLQKEELMDWARKTECRIIATLGAGDIDRLVEPLKETLMSRS